VNPPDSQPALYLLATLPPEPVLADVWALKQEVHRLTGSRNAVRLPPHITLLPPFRLPPAVFEPRALPLLEDFAAAQPPVEVGLRDFSWFGDRTLFVRVVADAALQQLHAALLARCRAALPEVPLETRPFTPHMTLATRDLPPAQVPQLKAAFAARRYAATCRLRTLTLFRHDGQQWHPVQEFALAGRPAQV
jgi:2'-5' RNA ligase